MKISEPTTSHLLLYPGLSQWKILATPYIIPPLKVATFVLPVQILFVSLIIVLINLKVDAINLSKFRMKTFTTKLIDRANLHRKLNQS